MNIRILFNTPGLYISFNETDSSREAQKMDIQITAKDVWLTPADETYIRNRLYFALAANHQDLDKVEVSLCAIPGFESEGIHIRHFRIRDLLLDRLEVLEEEPGMIRDVPCK